jgi:periplasmic protein TonB
MATMSGSYAPIPAGGRSPEERPELFATALVVSDPPRHARSFSLPVSIFGHGIAIALLALIPLFWPEIPPDHPDYIRALIYNPPPPPPPPLPKGSGLIEKTTPAKPVTPETQPEKPTLTADIEVPKEVPLKPEAREPETEQAGSVNGSDFGVNEGMEEGQEGGVVGGVPGGVLGGVVGGTGDGPVLDYDQAPRAIKITRPQYPQEAFVKKIEGTVELQIIIDSTGRVVRATVVKSIPLLDAAAIQTVQQWIFAPAIKNGRPVATVATAPVTFRIF